MTTKEKIEYKIMLREKCMEIIRQRIFNAAGVVENAQKAANAEEKSTAGDKYETGRAMNHLEKEMFSKQLMANKHELSIILSIECGEVYNQVKAGCIVRTEDACYFICAGLGKVKVNGEIIYLISTFAPIAALLMNKKKEDVFSFNKKEIRIGEIF